MEGNRKPPLTDERAVGQQIGVTLMVAILVIMAVVIGAFVLDLGNNVDQNPEAGVSFDQDPDTGEVTVRVNSVQRADKITVDGSDCGAPSASVMSLPNAGATDTVSCTQDGKIVVTATYDGNTEVISTYEYED